MERSSSISCNLAPKILCDFFWIRNYHIIIPVTVLYYYHRVSQPCSSLQINSLFCSLTLSVNSILSQPTSFLLSTYGSHIASWACHLFAVTWLISKDLHYSVMRRIKLGGTNPGSKLLTHNSQFLSSCVTLPHHNKHILGKRSYFRGIHHSVSLSIATHLPLHRGCEISIVTLTHIKFPPCISPSFIASSTSPIVPPILSTISFVRHHSGRLCSWIQNFAFKKTRSPNRHQTIISLEQDQMPIKGPQFS